MREAQLQKSLTNGLSNGSANEAPNGSANGSANGSVNGSINGYTKPKPDDHLTHLQTNGGSVLTKRNVNVN